LSSKVIRKMKEDKLIDSIKGMKRAEPNPFLFTRIEASLNKKTNKSQSTDWFFRLAFCLGVFFILANLIIINTPREEQTITQIDEVSIEPLADTILYTSIIQNFNFYENEAN
jgi:hypothetical protein